MAGPARSHPATPPPSWLRPARRGGVPSALADAGAGAVLAVGVVAAADLASLAAGGRVASWGPVATVAAGAAVALAGLPSAALVEGALAAVGRRTVLATATAYLAVSAAWSVMLWVGWRVQAGGPIGASALATEQGLIVAGAALIWAGARAAQRTRPLLVLGPALLLAAALAVSTAVAA